MALATNIVLADALATPVNHTYIPVGLDDKNVMWFEDQSQPTPLGFWRLSISLKRPKPPTAGTTATERSSRVEIWHHQPVLEVVGNTAAGYQAAPSVAFVPRSGIQYIVSERSTLQNRKDLRKMTSGINDNAQIISLVENFITLS